MVEELAGINDDVGGARRSGVAQKDRGVAPPVWIPRLSRLGTNGASLGGVGEAADARDALTGARAEEDELGLQPLVLLRRRGARNGAATGRRTGDAAVEGARGSEARVEGKPRRRRGRGGSEARRGRGGKAGERARDARRRRGLRSQERRSDRARSGAGHRRRRRWR